MLAYRLKRPISDIEQMRTTEFLEWTAFFELHDQSNKSQINRHNGKFR